MPDKQAFGPRELARANHYTRTHPGCSFAEAEKFALDQKTIEEKARFVDPEHLPAALRFARANPFASWERCCHFATFGVDPGETAVPSQATDPTLPLGGQQAEAEEEITVELLEQVLNLMRNRCMAYRAALDQVRASAGRV